MRKSRREEIVKEMSRLEAEVADIDRWLQAVSIIFPEAERFSSTNSRVSKDDIRSPLKLAILAALNGNPNGLYPREIAQIVRQGENEDLRHRLIENPNGHYNALDWLCSNNLVIKYNDKYYDRDHFWSDAMDTHSTDTSKHANQGMPSFILTLFRPGVALTPQDIAEAIRSDPVHKFALERNSGLVYSAINRLFKRKQLVRDGSYYRLATEQNEPNGAGTPNGSNAGSDEEPNKGVFG